MAQLGSIRTSRTVSPHNLISFVHEFDSPTAAIKKID